MKECLLSTKNLKISFATGKDRFVRVINSISMCVERGEIHGVVGESGCGKTVTAMSILKILPQSSKIEGEIIWKNKNITNFSNKEMRNIRGKEISIIFQNPEASLNPLYTIGQQFISVLMLDKSLKKKEANKKAIEFLKQVKMPDPKTTVNKYSHQLSGGMCQRAMIAMAISRNPDLLIADEPTASLDVTIQAQILELLKELNKKFGMSILLISHDMGVIAKMCDNVSVMYLGEIVEEVNVKTLYSDPKHPYTQALLKSVPIPNPQVKSKFFVLDGDVPTSLDSIKGCPFRSRCSYAFEKCSEEPELREIEKGHKVACWLYQRGV